MPTNPKAGPDSEMGTSNDHTQPGVLGLNIVNTPPLAGAGVRGEGPIGVEGFGSPSPGGIGVYGKANAGVVGESSGTGAPPTGLDWKTTCAGVLGGALHGDGVVGEGGGEGVGVKGVSAAAGPNGVGLLAGRDPVFKNPVGVYGQSDTVGVMGLAVNDSATGVYGGGASHAGDRGAGSIGVRGETFTGVGVEGRSLGAGLAGKFIGGVEVTGQITAHDVAVTGQITAHDVAVTGEITARDVAVTGHITAHDVEVTGDIRCHDVVLSGGDCAEDFDIAGLDAVDPGTVMVIDEAGSLRPCQNAYDKKVTGVISGAGDYKPGIILDKRSSTSNRLPLALLGKVYCKVDAEHVPIEIGDLLTTSSTAGHAMKACDPLKAFGSVIGKALRPMEGGKGLIPILVALQ
jgi:hypothetical protein